MCRRGPDGYVIRRAEIRDRVAVARELAAYLAHIGEDLDGEGLDHDIAHWEREYGGASGALLVVEDPAGDRVGTAGMRRLEAGMREDKLRWIATAGPRAGL